MVVHKALMECCLNLFQVLNGTIYERCCWHFVELYFKLKSESILIMRENHWVSYSSLLEKEKKEKNEKREKNSFKNNFDLKLFGQHFFIYFPLQS